MPQSERGRTATALATTRQQLTAGQMLGLWKHVFRLGRPDHYPRKFKFYSQTSTASEVFLLEDGLVKLTQLTLSGREVLICLRGPGELLGAPPTLLGQTYPFSATAVTECRAHKLMAKALSEAIAANTEAAKLIINTLSNDLFAAWSMLIDCRTLTARQRLDQIMAWLKPCLASRYPGVSLAHVGLPDVELASLIGVSPEHFSRIKKSRLKGRQPPTLAPFQ